MLEALANRSFYYKLERSESAHMFRPLCQLPFCTLMSCPCWLWRCKDGVDSLRCIIDLFLDTRTFSPLGTPLRSVCGCHSNFASVNSQMLPLNWRSHTTEPFIEAYIHNTHTHNKALTVVFIMISHVLPWKYNDLLNWCFRRRGDTSGGNIANINCWNHVVVLWCAAELKQCNWYDSAVCTV